MSEILKYRQRTPKIVDAVCLSAANAEEVMAWCNGRLEPVDHGYSGLHFRFRVGVRLVTKNRIQVAEEGDYIYRDQDGYFHIEKAELFEILFEENH